MPMVRRKGRSVGCSDAWGRGGEDYWVAGDNATSAISPTIDASTHPDRAFNCAGLFWCHRSARLGITVTGEMACGIT